MSLVAAFESFIERLMERSFARATGSRLQPVEIGKRIVRAMEASQSVGMEGVIVPNVYDVYLSPTDYDHFKAASASLGGNLETHVARTARQRRYHLVARPLVRLHLDGTLSAGDVVVEPHLEDVEGDFEPAPEHTALLPRMDGPVVAGPSAPNLILNGKSYAVLRSPTSIGRRPDNDIVLADKRVSRHHADLLQQGGRWMVRDNGSTNGTAVNGKVIREAVLGPGDTISLGGLEASWEQ
ncbi:MAG TPA: DUF3662 and FHA domain-containing protein [Chloroflexota bacterium]|nr:DUF3662 and FHA domain-containing protein [Chloroflexota bacterium]